MSTFADTDNVSLPTIFCELPSNLNYRYSDEVHNTLTQRLFLSCFNGNPDHGKLLFPNGHPAPDPTVTWSLREAQGAVEGAEYTEAARGQACGHIFRPGEASYQCRTCASDPTCVLCARCFDASDHEGHPVYIHASDGNSGCCDCGDAEAWTRPVHCGIHSHDENITEKSKGKAKAGPEIPQDLIDNLHRTIAQCLDYMCDVWSCSPEQLRANKTEESVWEDERKSQLAPETYGGPDPASEHGEAIEYALVLWNDEKHTVQDVRDIVARACRVTKAEGRKRAEEIDLVGRTIVKFSRNLNELLKAALILEQPKLSVTIRSSRDIFREQMCGTMIQWMLDISGCAVGSNGKLLKQIICEELIQEWHVGSLAHHKLVGQDGIYDHDREEVARDLQSALGPYSTGLIQRLHQAWGTNNEEEDNDEEESDEQGPVDDGDSMEVDDPADSGHPTADDSMNIDSPRPAQTVEDGVFSEADPRTRNTDNELSDEGESSETLLAVPRTPAAKVKKIPRPPGYWRDLPEGSAIVVDTPEENLRERVRLDWLILYDLRMWKQLRIDLREVFITTLIGIPKFKRLLALRFASVFTVLAELHLIADREPDHSLIFLSLQLLTVPSITAEVVERGNFLTNLMAIIYTFLSTRQVGYPHQVDLTATLAIDQGVVFNRRAQTFYHDMRHMLSLEVVRERIRVEPRYLLQFLDIAKIHQGICPNIRATGEHVEYEMEAWMSLSTVMTEVMRLCRSFAESFQIQDSEHVQQLESAIRTAAATATIHSIGAEKDRFQNSEIKEHIIFQSVPRFEFEHEWSSPVWIPQYVVAEQPMSCYHPLHYMLAWLLTEHRSASVETIRELINFHDEETLMQYATSKQASSTIKRLGSQHFPYLLVLFDYPIRVCSWMAQTRAGMWVRNGLSLRHQIQQYRSASRRELTYQRDIFLVQTAFVVCNPRDVLAQLIDRFDLLNWVTGNYEAIPGRDEAQTIDIAEELIHLLIVLLCDRLNLVVGDREKISELTTKRELIHALCYKPLSYADLKKSLTERVKEADDQGLLQAMTTYKAPEGMTDHGTFTLKDQYFSEIDPYIPFLTRNQREEAEMAYRKHIAKQTGKDLADIVYEPSIMPIENGMFKEIHLFTMTPLFAQMIFYFLQYTMMAPTIAPDVQATKIEQLFQFTLQLILVAIKLDDLRAPVEQEKEMWLDTETQTAGNSSYTTLTSFSRMILEKKATRVVSSDTIAGLLRRSMDLDHLKSSGPRVKCIFLNLQTTIPTEFGNWMSSNNLPLNIFGQSAPASDPAVKALKKKQAMDRQAKVMEQFKKQQATFLENQDMEWDDQFDDLEDDDMTVTGHEKVTKFPSGSCILCQEETDDNKLYGTFGFITESRVFRNTPLFEPNWVEEVLEIPDSLDEGLEDRPFGVASKNRRAIQKTTADGRVIQLDRQDLAQGFPISHCTSGAVSVGCGHIMHHTCYEVYVAATARRHATQIARHHPESIEHYEFLCPLCKALGNTFLPIVWKPQPLIYPGNMAGQNPLEESIQSLMAKKGSIYDDAPSVMQKYAERTFMPTLAAQVQPALSETSMKGINAPPLVPGFRILPFDTHVESFTALLGMSRQPSTSSSAPTPTTEMRPSIMNSTLNMKDLKKAYAQLSDSLKWTRPDPIYAEGKTFWREYGVLISSLGYSIKAVEIAQRGVASDTNLTFLEKISSQTTTHLRVLSETIMSFLTIHHLTGMEATSAAHEYTERTSRILRILFIDECKDGHHPDACEHVRAGRPIFSLDPFTCLSELSFWDNKDQPLDFNGLLKVFLTLEIVRVVLLCTFRQLGDAEYEKLGSTLDGHEVPDSFVIFMDTVLSWRPQARCIPLNILYSLVKKYALPFLRSSVLLFHVRFGIDFPSNSVQGSELDRLTHLLLIPTLPQLLEDINNSSASLSMIKGWIQHMDYWYEDTENNDAISLGHPAIFELIGLPKNYDTLQDEVMRRKCPTSGRPLWDPAICLICGDIFCSQSVCCTKDEVRGPSGTPSRKVGGCWQHRQK